jgi:DNA (cytosine-5)-methyltransferase 1
MRTATGGAFPRYAVLENVPGLYTSNKGLDFLEVLNELIQIKDGGRSVSRPASGKWANAGEIVADNFSIALRTLDAQFFGVPQRRRRCYIIVDFTSDRAGQILFDEPRLLGNPAASGSQVQESAGGITGSPPAASGGITDVFCLEGNGSRPSHRGTGISDSGVSYTLNTVERHAVAYALDRAAFNQGKNAQYNIGVEAERAQPLVSRGPGAVADSRADYAVRRFTPQECAMLQGFSPNWCDDLETDNPTEADISFWTDVFEEHRRITNPQGNSKTRTQIVRWLKNPFSDAAAYKMWGNGICRQCAEFILGNIAYYD